MKTTNQPETNQQEPKMKLTFKLANQHPHTTYYSVCLNDNEIGLMAQTPFDWRFSLAEEQFEVLCPKGHSLETAIRCCREYIEEWKELAISISNRPS